MNDFTVLIDEIEQYRKELADLIVRDCELRFFVCPRLDTEYTLFIGMFEYQIYKYQFSTLCLRKELEMRSAGQKVAERDKRNIEKEYEQLRRKAEELLNHIRECLNDSGYVDDRSELNRLYEEVLHKVHPDLNEHYNEKRNEYLQKAETAYKKGRVYLLKELAQQTSGFTVTDYRYEKDAAVIYEARNRLRKKTEELRAKVYKTEHSYPYDKKELLATEESVRARQTELNRRIYDLKEEAEYYYRKLGELNNG